MVEEIKLAVNVYQVSKRRSNQIQGEKRPVEEQAPHSVTLSPSIHLITPKPGNQETLIPSRTR